MRGSRSYSSMILLWLGWCAAAADPATVPDLLSALGRPEPASRAALDVLTERIESLRLEGRLTEAERVARDTLTACEESFGATDARVAYVLHTLSLVLMARGNLAEARPLLERSLLLHHRQLDPDPFEIARTRDSLGVVYQRTGNYAPAQEEIERALASFRAQLGNEHRLVARMLVDLALVRQELGDPAGAARAVAEALAIRDRLEDPGPESAGDLYNVALALLKSGDLERARPYLERSLKRQTAARGNEHRSVALAKMMLGRLMTELGRSDRAVGLLEDSARTLERTVGLQNHHLPEAYSYLASAHAAAGQSRSAFESALRAEALVRDQFRGATRIFSENEALRYAAVRVSGLETALALVEGGSESLPSDAAERVFDQLIRSRTLVLDEMATRHPYYLRDAPSMLIERLEDLERAREKLARLAVVGLSSAPSAGHEERLAVAQEAVERAERRVAELSRSFRERQVRFAAGLREVSRVLPEESALLAYAAYRGRMLAFVLRAGETRPEVVSLGGLSAIDGLVARWRDEVGTPLPVLPAAAARAEARYRETGQSLARAVWDPIAARLGERRLVFVVPDGPLHRVSLATLPLEHGGFLADRPMRIHYLSSERDLLRSPAARRSGAGLLVIGGPDFDALFEVPSPRPVAPAPQASTRGGRTLCGQLRERTFHPLPGARAEAAEIASLWTGRKTDGASEEEAVLLLTGPRAREERFKSVAPGRRIIHVATHGYFAPPGCGSILRPANGGAESASVLENPLLHSGLVFAGANHREQLRDDAEREDGMLTAQEIASIDLSGAEWVVLSACETGVGPVQSGEGVLGLRRAFEIAGSDTLIMSLWEVKDEAAREWMRHLYAGRLAGRSTADAVHEATRG